jgi:chromosome segregation ATPase
MAGIVRTVVRIGVITALVGGVAVVAAGPDSVRAFLHQTRQNVKQCIDSHVSDPVALRAQLRDLEGQYPKRIAAVRGDLAEVSEQIAQLNRELEVSRRVVALADQHLQTMQGVLAKAEQTKQGGGFQVVKVRFDDQSLSLDDAYAKANRVSQVRSAYSTKASDVERDLGYLGQQRDRLAKLLDKLEKERADFQSQLWTLDRQVDTIARNDRLIALLQDRQKTIDEQSRYEAVSLDQVTARFAEIRAKQEAKLEMFGQNSDMENYEDAARSQLDYEKSRPAKTSGKPAAKGVEMTPSVIEIGPEDVTQDAPLTGGQVATRGG